MKKTGSKVKEGGTSLRWGGGGWETGVKMGRPSYEEGTELLFSETTSLVSNPPLLPSYPSYPLSTHPPQLGAMAASLLAIVGSLGNSLTIAALLQVPTSTPQTKHPPPQSRYRSHPTSICLVALSASDLLFCLYNLPLTAHRVSGHHPTTQ